MNKIAIINASTVLTDLQVQAAIPDLQIQISRDFAPQWGEDALLYFYSGNNTIAIPADYFWISILDNADSAGYLGFHDVSPSGMPIGKVFAGTDIQYQSSWTVTISHEILELLADKSCSICVQRQDGTFIAQEVGDPCEDDSYGYKINDTLVSDFVFPSYFEDLPHIPGTQFDYCKQIVYPFQILSNGYIGVYDPKTMQWSQRTAQLNSGGNGNKPQAMFKEAEFKNLPRIGSRREKRIRGRNNWFRSEIKA